MKMNCGFFCFEKCNHQRERAWNCCGRNKWKYCHSPCWEPFNKPCLHLYEKPCNRSGCEGENNWSNIAFYGQISFKKESNGCCGSNNNYKYYNQFNYGNDICNCNNFYPELWQF